MAGQNEVAAEFRQPAFRPPQGLALLDMPAGTRCGEERLGGGLTAAENHEAGQQNGPEQWAGQIMFEEPHTTTAIKFLDRLICSCRGSFHHTNCCSPCSSYQASIAFVNFGRMPNSASVEKVFAQITSARRTFRLAHRDLPFAKEIEKCGGSRNTTRRV